MKTTLATCLMAAAAFHISAAPAATLIEERDSESSTITYIEGGKMRAQSPGEDAYMLMDLLGRTMFTVSPAEKQAIDMSSMVFGQAGSETRGTNRSVKSTLEKVGSGPEIAGYSTDHYVLTANGRKCQEYFTSRKAFEDSGWADLWNDVAQSMKDMAVSEEDADECDIAEAEVMDPGEVGWPLKTIDEDGLVSEVVRIESNTNAPPGGFEVPAGYSVISMQEMLSGAMMGGPGLEIDSEAPEDEYMEEEDSFPDEEEQEEAGMAEQMEGLFNELKKGLGN